MFYGNPLITFWLAIFVVGKIDMHLVGVLGKSPHQMQNRVDCRVAAERVVRKATLFKNPFNFDEMHLPLCSCYLQSNKRSYEYNEYTYIHCMLERLVFGLRMEILE